ncbi:maestro heat-like repeat-containing protein family member 7 [Grus japonensis]|uniref:Maestro heat-like repeat-containing protein family member 7 n=1 Tax=Grus japonensis TaxID=30415 RepID=A0ABC9Y5M6_GRUJA
MNKTRLVRYKPGGGMPMFEGQCASEVLPSAPQCAEYTGAHLKCPCTNVRSTLAISVEVGNRDPRSSKDAKIDDVLETTEVPENSHIGIRASPPKKMSGSIAKLNCVYTNACSMGNKQEELEAIVQLENYDIVAITETWWDDTHNWSATMDGSSERIGKEGEAVG